MSYTETNGIYQAKSDGEKLFFRRWQPESPSTKKVLVIHHGMGEHSARYENVLNALDGQGLTIYSYDARGHGKSPGKKGHSDGISQLVEDLEGFIEFIHNEYDVQKPILLGHSLGGLVALSYAVKDSNQNNLKALVANGSALEVHLDFINNIKVAIGRILAKIAPEFIMPTGLDVKAISHDKEVLKAYKSDSLVHGVISAKLGIDLVDAGALVIENADKLTIPVLISHGGDDKIIPSSGSKRFFEKAQSSDKSLKIYSGAYHETYNESEEIKKVVLTDLKEWLHKHW